MHKSAVISGGGSWGAFTVGRLKQINPDYHLVVGCSTGAIMAPLTALGKWDRLIEAYTSVQTSDIFNVNPFTKRGRVNIPKALWRIITGRKTIGESESLFKLIQRMFTIEDYNEIISQGKDVVVTVCNLSARHHNTEYKSIKDYDYETFCKFMWASASFPLVGSIVTVNGYEYSDGGIAEGTPLFRAIGSRTESIDVFLHNLPDTDDLFPPVKGVFRLLSRLITIQRKEISYNDLALGVSVLDCAENGVKINIYNLNRVPEHSYLTFDKEVMFDWVKSGYTENLAVV